MFLYATYSPQLAHCMQNFSWEIFPWSKLSFHCLGYRCKLNSQFKFYDSLDNISNERFPIYGALYLEYDVCTCYSTCSPICIRNIMVTGTCTCMEQIALAIYHAISKPCNSSCLCSFSTNCALNRSIPLLCYIVVTTMMSLVSLPGNEARCAHAWKG